MPVLSLTKSQIDLVVACIDNTETEYRLKAIAGPANGHSGLSSALEELSRNIKEQARGRKNEGHKSSDNE